MWKCTAKAERSLAQCFDTDTGGTSTAYLDRDFFLRTVGNGLEVEVLGAHNIPDKAGVSTALPWSRLLLHHPCLVNTAGPAYCPPHRAALSANITSPRCQACRRCQHIWKLQRVTVAS